MVGHETWTAPTTWTPLMQALTHSHCNNALMYLCNACIEQFACAMHALNNLPVTKHLHTLWKCTCKFCLLTCGFAVSHGQDSAQKILDDLLVVDTISSQDIIKRWIDLCIMFKVAPV